PVVDLGDPNRSGKRPPVVILLVEVFRRAPKVQEPFLRVQVFIPEQIVGSAMKPIGAGLGCKALHTTGGASKLRRNGGSGDFEFLQGLNGRGRLVKRRTAIGTRRASTIQ